MKEHPILFSGPMVRALLEGRKTQTRRIVKPQPKVVHNIYPDASIATNCTFRRGDQRIHCPYGKPGDRLWVKETFLPTAHTTYFRADFDPMDAAGHGALYGGWKPSIFMPRRLSRITLEVVDVRVERLQDISEEDAEAEGAYPEFEIDLASFVRRAPVNSTHYLGFKHVWRDINGMESWDANPWVWVVEFKKLEVPA